MLTTFYLWLDMGFKVGNNANPKGALTRKPITDALIAILTLPREYRLDGKGVPKSNKAAILAEVLYKKAESGDLTALNEVLNRVEGKATQSLDINHSGEIASIAVDLSATLGFLANFTGNATPLTIQGDAQERLVLSSSVGPE